MSENKFPLSELQKKQKKVVVDLTDQIADPKTPENQRVLFREAVKFIAAQAREKLETARKSLHDSLTGIPLREKYERGLERAIDENAGSDQPPIYVVVSIDLGKFKEINDTYGHTAGDKVLIAVAKALQKELRIEDFISRDVDDVAARTGGDEFRLLMKFKAGTPTDVIENRLTTIQNNLGTKEEYKVLNGISPNLSMGAAAFTKPDAGLSRSDFKNRLLNASDALMYRNKTERNQEADQTSLKVPVVLNPDAQTTELLMKQMAAAKESEKKRYEPTPPIALTTPPPSQPNPPA